MRTADAGRGPFSLQAGGLEPGDFEGLPRDLEFLVGGNHEHGQRANWRGTPHVPGLRPLGSVRDRSGYRDPRDRRASRHVSRESSRIPRVSVCGGSHMRITHLEQRRSNHRRHRRRADRGRSSDFDRSARRRRGGVRPPSTMRSRGSSETLGPADDWVMRPESLGLSASYSTAHESTAALGNRRVVARSPTMRRPRTEVTFELT